MNTVVKKIKRLTDKETAEIIELVSVCNKYDGSGYVFDCYDDFKKEDDINTFLLYSDGRLTSVLNIFAPKKSEAEITGFTEPLKRKKGFFKKLLNEAQAELEGRGIYSILFVVDSNSVSGISTAAKMMSVYDFSEYLMRYFQVNGEEINMENEIKLEKADPCDCEILAEINSDVFNSSRNESSEIIKEFFKSRRRTLYSIYYHDCITGMIGVCEESERVYIYGFCVAKDFQGRGIGRQALTRAVEICRKNTPGTVIDLEVQSGNENALRLYKKCGFAVQNEFRYYRKSIKKLY